MVGNLRAKPLDAGSGRFVVEGNPPFLSGYPVGTSKHVPYTANAAKLIFGDWNQLLIGLWSALLDGLGSANKSRSLIGPDPRKDEMLRFALGQITVLDRRNRIQDMTRNESWYEEAMEEHVVRAFAGAPLSGIYQASEKNKPIAHFDS